MKSRGAEAPQIPEGASRGPVPNEARRCHWLLLRTPAHHPPPSLPTRLRPLTFPSPLPALHSHLLTQPSRLCALLAEGVYGGRKSRGEEEQRSGSCLSSPVFCCLDLVPTSTLMQDPLESESFMHETFFARSLNMIRSSWQGGRGGGTTVGVLHFVCCPCCLDCPTLFYSSSRGLTRSPSV